MQTSLHPADMVDREGRQVPNTGFPLCLYEDDDQDSVGLKFPEYPEDRFCNSFQPTFNEYGLCYTYNNVKLGLDQHDWDSGKSGERSGSSRPPHPDLFRIRKVAGCGKERGFQMVIDSHKIMNLIPPEKRSKGFKV